MIPMTTENFTRYVKLNSMILNGQYHAVDAKEFTTLNNSFKMMIKDAPPKVYLALCALKEEAGPDVAKNYNILKETKTWKECATGDIRFSYDPYIPESDELEWADLYH